MNADNEPVMAQSPGLTYAELLDADTHSVPAVLRLRSPRYLGDTDVPASRYTSRAWHELEIEHLWKRVWQYACREEHLPRAGDYVVYDIANLSFIVMRTSDGTIKAYRNACLHRGRQLKDASGHCSELRCPFHAWAWTIDGELRHVPAAWDFPDFVPEQWRLPEARVGTWAGFVFINPDTACEPLETFLGELPEHFDEWHLEDRYVAVHVARVVPANWKVVQEAFCESYHVSGTHPQTLRYLGDTNSQVDIWGNFARVITASGTPSPLLRSETTTEDTLRAMLDLRIDRPTPINLRDGDTARAVAADLARNRWRPIVGARVDSMSDAELVDNIDYTLFPNFHPWGAFNRIVYRFRPNGDDHRSSIMEVLFLSPFNGERPPPAQVHWLGDHEPFAAATELGTLGKVFDQDLFNMPKVQRGLESTAKPGVTLATYQESKIRWLHAKLTDWVEA